MRHLLSLFLFRPTQFGSHQRGDLRGYVQPIVTHLVEDMRAAVQHVFQGKGHFASDGVDHLCLEIGQAGDKRFGQTLVALGVGQYLGVSSAVGGN